MKRTKVIALFSASAMALCLLLPGCSSGDAANGDTTTGGTGNVVNVYNWGEYIDTDLLDTFTQKTGIRVNYSTFDSNETMYAKLKSGSVSYDVVIPSDYMISRMINEGMLAPLDYSQIPNSANIDDSYRTLAYDPTDEYSIPYMWGTTGIIYNPAMVNAPITGWNDLFDISITGTRNVLMFDNSRDCIAVALLALGYDINTNDAAQIKEAVDLLIQQKEAGIVQAYVMDQIFDKLANNEAGIGVYYAGDYLTIVEDNPDLVWVQPETGSNLFVDAMCVPSCYSNYDNAMAFINFMCSDEACLANAEEVGYSTPSATAYEQLDPEIRENTVAYPPQEFLAECTAFINLDSDTLALYDSEWTRLGLAKAG